MAKREKKAPSGARANPWRVDPKRLRKARDTAGMTQFDLAIAAGVLVRPISDAERGVDIGMNLETAGALADALGVDIRWLCNRTKSAT